MPMKYFFDLPLAVKIVGMVHGVLFLGYCFLLAISMKRFGWSLKFGIYLFVATLIPFGTFVTDRKLKILEEEWVESNFNLTEKQINRIINL